MSRLTIDLFYRLKEHNLVARVMITNIYNKNRVGILCPDYIDEEYGVVAVKSKIVITDTGYGYTGPFIFYTGINQVEIKLVTLPSGLSVHDEERVVKQFPEIKMWGYHDK